jgi:hypothetical protein
MKKHFASALALMFATGGSAYAGEHGKEMSFKDMDTDKDGYISNEEAQENKLLSQHMRMMDKDKNGQLSMNEFEAFNRASKSASDLSPEVPVGKKSSSY